MEDINLDILRTVVGALRKRALELHSLEDDGELRAFLNLLVESKLELIFFTILNGQIKAWTPLFKSIDNKFVYSNIESLQ